MDEILNKIKAIIEDISNEHPYKVSGDCSTYGQYNEAWQDYCDRILSEITGILSQQKEPCDEYIAWLECMTILLSNCYQQTHDMLLQKMKEGNKAYLEMPVVQGFEMSMMVDKISKLKPDGRIMSDKLEGFTNWLIEQYKPIQQSTGAH